MNSLEELRQAIALVTFEHWTEFQEPLSLRLLGARYARYAARLGMRFSALWPEMHRDGVIHVVRTVRLVHYVYCREAWDSMSAEERLIAANRLDRLHSSKTYAKSGRSLPSLDTGSDDYQLRPPSAMNATKRVPDTFFTGDTPTLPRQLAPGEIEELAEVSESGCVIGGNTADDETAA